MQRRGVGVTGVVRAVSIMVLLLMVGCAGGTRPTVNIGWKDGFGGDDRSNDHADTARTDGSSAASPHVVLIANVPAPVEKKPVDSGSRQKIRFTIRLQRTTSRLEEKKSTIPGSHSIPRSLSSIAR